VVDIEADDIALCVEIDDEPFDVSRASTPGLLLSSM
jgi:hypothetical protein